MDRLENRAIIKFCRDPGETPTEDYKMITVAPSKTSVSQTLIFKWYKRFQKSSVRKKTLTSICNALSGEGQLIVHALSERFDLSIGAVYKVLTKQLNMSKIHYGDYFEKK